MVRVGLADLAADRPMGRSPRCETGADACRYAARGVRQATRGKVMPQCAMLTLGVSLLLAASPSAAQPATSASPQIANARPRVTDALLEDAPSVFSLTIAQDQSLNLIQAKYPDLRERVLEARHRFREAFEPAIGATDAVLAQRLGKEWETTKSTLISKTKDVLPGQITLEDAEEYIRLVERRAAGQLPRRIYVVLAAVHPDYCQRPELEVTRGFTSEFKSDGSGRSLGLKLALQYPLSWAASEGRRPHILWKASSHDSLANGMLLVKAAPETKDSVEKTLSYLTSEEYLDSEAPGARRLASGRRTIAGQPSAYLDYVRSLTRTIGKDDVCITMSGRFYFLIYDKALVVLAVDVSDTRGADEARVRQDFQRHEKLFDLIALSLDVLNRYP